MTSLFLTRRRFSRERRRDLLHRFALAAATALALAGASDVRAEPTPTTDTAFVQPNDMGTGALLLRTKEPGKFVEAPRLKTDISIDATGPIARAKITQRFENPTDKWVEGVYVFPLPQGAGVDTLRLQVGDRFLEGNIKERQEARQIYERAAAQGIKATLVEQERPNMFTNSVANIGPHETVVVQIEYQETVRLDGDRFSLRVPLVVGPRYIPDPQIAMVSANTESPTIAVNDPVPDRDRISPPVLHPKYGKINPVTLSVRLKSGVAISAIESGYHLVDIERAGLNEATVSLRGDVPADRDFTLSWTLAASSTPQATIFKQTIGSQNYYLAMVVPPTGTNRAPRQPRESIFVIDNSGSMAGESMQQAKEALVVGLKKLGPNDRFNVVRFDDTFEKLFGDAVPADETHIAIAERFVMGLDANGGTEILAALQAALQDSAPTDQTHLRQIVFLTDGAVGNEDQVLAEIGKNLGRSRLFTVGIGSAPNSFLMEHVARLGRGTFTHIGSTSEVVLRMTELFNKLESPVMTNLRVTTNDPKIETWPNPIPDLYTGEPVVLTAVTNETDGVIRLEGKIGNDPWTAALDLSSAVEGPGVSKLWARSKIGAIEDWRYRGASQGDIDAAVLKVALEHHLVSRLTSLVAVDVKVSRPQNEALTTQAMPTNLPHGWDFEKVFGEDPSQPRPQPTEYRRAELSDVQLAALDGKASPPKPGDPSAANTAGVPLPQGGAGSDLQILLGALLLLASAFMFVMSRRTMKVRA